MNRLFSFDVSVIHDLNEQISKGNRSTFVNAAVKCKLYGNESPTISEMHTRNVMAALLARDDISSFLQRTLMLELKAE